METWCIVCEVRTEFFFCYLKKFKFQSFSFINWYANVESNSESHVYIGENIHLQRYKSRRSLREAKRDWRKLHDESFIGVNVTRYECDVIMINCTVGDAAGAEEERDASFGHKN
jgi:hypothetical protein